MASEALWSWVVPQVEAPVVCRQWEPLVLFSLPTSNCSGEFHRIIDLHTTGCVPRPCREQGEGATLAMRKTFS